MSGAARLPSSDEIAVQAGIALRVAESSLRRHGVDPMLSFGDSPEPAAAVD